MATAAGSSAESEALKIAFDYLVNSINTATLLPKALSSQLISDRERSECAREPEPYEKAEKFLGHLQRTVNGDSNKYHTFVQVLRQTGQTNIASRLCDELAKANRLLSPGEQLIVPSDKLLEELAGLRISYARFLRRYKKVIQDNAEAQEEFVETVPGVIRRELGPNHGFQSYFNTLIDEEVSLFNITYLKKFCDIFPDDVCTATKELVDKYEKQRHNFMASTTLNQFKQLFPASATSSQLSAGKILITVKLEPYWGDNTIDDLTTLVNSFGVPGCHLHLYNVQKGCIAATWLCPAVDFKELRGIVEAADSLESKGVLRVFDGEEEIMWECSQPDQDDDGQVCIVGGFSNAEPLEKQFWFMTQESKCDIFVKFLNERLVALGRDKCTLSMNDVMPEVWTPVFARCEQVLEQIMDFSIPLPMVNDLFHGKDNDLIGHNIKQLQKGVEWCRSRRDVKDFEWIKQVIDRMNQFWKLSGYTDAAQTFLEIRDALKLTGDFNLVENVALQASISMTDQTLMDIDESVVIAAEFLGDFGKEKRDCLRAYAESQDIVKWINEVTDDVSDLQNFVNISLAIAAGDEDVLTRDRLSNLRTVGSGFGALIYDLPSDASYQILVNRCRTLWEILDYVSNLSQMMRDCNTQTDWYKSIKETQGSVEKTSYGQMNNIYRYGSYIIAHTSQSQVIHLKLNDAEDKNLTKTSYSLDDLSDLESKLVLITGRDSRVADEVQVFLQSLACVRRIADALMALQQHGSGDYIGWEMKCPCNLPNVVDQLQHVASNLENDLEQWKHEIQEQRDQFYELNYYTTQQLLLLRKELGRLQEPGENVVNPEAMALLLSISRDVSGDVMKEYVLDVTQKEQQKALASASAIVQADHVSSTCQPSEQSAQPEPVDLTISAAVVDLLKSEATKTSTPQAIQQEDDLGIEQKAILANIRNNFGYHKQLVLLAFERCENPCDLHAVIAWCMDNQNRYTYDDYDDDDEEEEEGEEEEDEPLAEAENKTSTPWAIQQEDDLGIEQKAILANIRNNFGCPMQLVFLAFKRCENPCDLHAVTAWCMDNQNKYKFDDDDDDDDDEPAEKMVTVVERIAVDEHHSVVKELLDLDFNLLEQCELSGKQSTVKLFSVDVNSSKTSVALEIPSHVSSIDEKKLTITRSQTKKYLMLMELGVVLNNMSSDYPSPVQSKRQFPEKVLRLGEPNLLVTPADNVLKTTLALYMEGGDQSLPMPTYEEVLVCSEWTTDEEVVLLWRRALGDPGHFRVFCLVHAERLSHQVCDRALWSLSQLSQGQKEYRIVIICSNEDESKSHVISKLQFYQRPCSTLQPDIIFAEYLLRHFKRWPECAYKKVLSGAGVASAVDPDKSYVRLVTSQRAGMGKSLYVKRRTEDLLKSVTTDGPHEVIVPIHGPTVTPDTVVGAFMPHIEKNFSVIFHLDIAPNVLWQVDSILFCLLVLQGVCDSQGNVWRCHPAHLYMIESTIPKGAEGRAASCTISLFKLLPSVVCVSPRQLQISTKLKANCVPMDNTMFHSPSYQRVYQYLYRHINQKRLDTISYQPGSVEGTTTEFLKVMLSECGVKNPSWVELNHFLMFLDFQLGSCEESIFCNEDIVGDVMSGLKTFVVKFMIRMSKDFATSSLRGEVATENEEQVEMDTLEEYTIAERKEWEKSYHPYLFFNNDGYSITFVGFNANSRGDLIDPVKNARIEGLEGVLNRQLHTGLKQNGVDLSENYQLWNKRTMMEKMGLVLGLECLRDPDPSYVLTIDNMIKMLAIQMRFRCNIPVVVMGETGCGKTRLIRFMCDMIALSAGGGIECVRNMLIMKVHGGTTEKDVIGKVEEAETLATVNREKGISTILFFDEANTTEAIGLIKEVMCDRRVHGREISKDVNFIAACNPYRKHTDEMIKKLELAGLGFYIKATVTQQRLGKIPLRHLVYRVLELPPSMRPLVYDFGQLTSNTEQDYTRQIVLNHCSQTHSQQEITAISRVLAWCQNYMRERKDECSFVSLRDVERAMIVFKFFTEKMSLFAEHIASKAVAEDGSKTPLQDAPTWSLVLSLGICYHTRLQDRVGFEMGVVQQFTSPLALPGGVEQFRDEIRWCQEVLLENMRLGRNIARNAALRENVFIMAINIELRIPLFLVGKPGSSKSLAKSIVATSMQGNTSEKDLLKQFKQVHMFSYQCSQLSTPESVIEVFNTAKSFQKDADTTKFVSVVVLDEVGLAEDSPNLPLKALHPLLEDGTEGAANSKQIIDHEKRVAFIGISNWALDPAKMNRGVMVTRGDPDTAELELSARGICSNIEDDPVRKLLDRFFTPLAEAYIEICKKQEREFYGLRDFYSLIKMLYWMCEQSQSDPTGDQLEHAIKRNFGGREQAYEIFKSKIPELGARFQKHEDVPEKLRAVLHPDCSPLGLIRTSLKNKETTWHGENRYLLFLTENYAALQVLKHYLQEVVGLPATESSDGHTDVDGAGGLEESGDGSGVKEKQQKWSKKIEPFVLFGSSFPKDKEYTQVCHNINQIKICMETGRTVILLNLENLYESFYDLLNQYYIMLGDNRYVDLGLQTHRVKCRVHENFKLIIIAKKDTVYEKFPIPLINRLEKHFVLTRTVLLPWQEKVVDKLVYWVKQFSRTEKFNEQDSFVGYQNDTPASVVFQATEQLREEQGGQVNEEMEESEEWLDLVMKRSKSLMVQMASIDALIRLQCTDLSEEERKNIEAVYTEHHLSSIRDFLNHYLQQHLHQVKQDDYGGLLLHVTTYSHLLSSTEMEELCNDLGFSPGNVKWFLLQEFDTEMDFSNKAKLMFEQQSETDSLLIVQCDSGHLYGDLITCARYRVDDEREKSNHLWTHGHGRTHVLFIIHLLRRGGGDDDGRLGLFVGFQGGRWLSAHIDDLRTSDEAMLSIDDAKHTSICDLFYSERSVRSSEAIMALNQEEEGEEEEEEGEEEQKKEDENRENRKEDKKKTEETSTSRLYQCSRLYSCIQAAVARVVTSDNTKEWAIRRVKILLDLIPQQPKFPLVSPSSISDDSLFYATLVRHIHSVLRQREEATNERTDWVVEEAMSGKKLQSGGTFRNVLSRKLDEVIIPYFAEVLVSVDRYSNLDLMRNSAPPHIRRMWLSVFTCSELCSFSYNDISVRGGDKLAGMGQRKLSGDEFRCQFPFFWLIKETVESHWDNTISMTGGHHQQIHHHLCELLTGTGTGEMLSRVSEQDEENCCDLYQCYLRDYIRSVHHVMHKQSSVEYKLIEKTLDTIISGPDLSSHSSTHSLLLSRIAAVHVVYHHCQRELLWFGRLTAQLPGVLVKLQTITHSPDKMELHLHAVKEALKDDLVPPLSQKNKMHLPQWLTLMQLCQNVIDSILTLGQEIEGLAADLFGKWQRVRAVQMFVEHVISKHDIKLEMYGNRLNFCLSNMCDFTTNETVAAVQRTLQAMEGELEKNMKLSEQKRKSIRNSCHAFFMEMVSTLCFRQRGLPEPELMEGLMNIVLTSDKTKDFTYSDKTEADKNPVIRSFLLQLLLEHDMECVRGYLKDYFDRSFHHCVGVDHLSLLCIQCFEDAVFKQHSQLTLQQRISSSLQLLREGREGMTDHHHSPTTLPYLEAVAKLRYSLSVVAELLYTQLTVERQQQYTHNALLLLEEAKRCCFIPQLNEDEAGPAVYLVKLLMRQYGPSFMSRVCDHTEFLWVVPEHLKQTDEEGQRMDRFVIYNGYCQLRSALVDAAYGQQMDELKESCHGLTPDESVPLLLAVYEVVTQSHSYRQLSKHIPDETVTSISSFIKSLTMLNRELKWTAEALLRNTQGGRMDALCCQPDHTPHTVLLSGVVVHTAITILAMKRLDIMQPLFKMVEKPGDLQQAYLPTMAQDALPEVRRAGGSYYECPRGHPYFVGNCGRPVEEKFCPVCGSTIGGQMHILRSDNKVVRQTDITETGYCLGSPEQRETLPIPERTLSSAACAILRAIMHSALLWCSCNNENAVEGLLDLTHSKVRSTELAGFFWRHLEHDIGILGKAVGKSEDDACLLLHLILMNMATKTPAQSSSMQEHASLLAINAREQWEKCFDQEYIQPVLSALEKEMGDAMQLILSDKKENRDRLFYTAYEKSSLTTSVLPHLWTYRSRITLEHLYQTLQAQRMKYKCPILHEFLKEEPILRATQYLPELVQLQKQMFEFSHRRLDRKEAASLTIREYIKTLKEHKKSLFREQFKCVRRAWELVKGKLTEYARVRVPQECLGVTLSEELKLEWLIPTLTGPGMVTVAILDLLVGAHNDFIEKSQNMLKKGQKETNLTWIKQQVPVTHVQLCHLLDYEHQLLSIVLSHCQYSLTYGHGQDISYDLPALQKHIVDRFIHGKPQLMLDIPQVIYRKDVYTATSFANIRKKVSPQTKLSPREEQDIVADLQSVQRIRDCLDVVEIVMGFLASGGQKADTRLDHYLTTALKMNHRFSSRKALEYCNLGQVLSLWVTLSVELARLLTLSDQEPFDTLHQNYLAELTDSNTDKLNRLLPKWDLHELLCTLYEFIETNVRHHDPHEHEWGLKDTLEAHLDYYSLPQLADLKYLPEDITIGQAVSLWKHIVVYQQRKKTNTSTQLY